jgi:8-oxo-(d)GTP phosphatase
MAELREATPWSADEQAEFVPGYCEPVRAAGAVLYRGRAEGPEVALIHRPHRSDWTLPKGKLKKNEHLLAAAVREVTEETGVRPVLERRLPPSRYVSHGWPKQVEWWSARAEAVVGAPQGDEVDAVEWLGVAQARERLSYGHDRAVLDAFAAGPIRTVPVVVLRHADAGRKGEVADDLLRPLNRAGQADARTLVDLLGAFGAMRVHTSPAARCVETVAPYLCGRDAGLRTAPVLAAPETWSGAGGPLGGGEAAELGDGDTAAAQALITELVQRGEPALVCTHGSLAGPLLRAALAALGAPPTPQAGLAKAAFWALHLCPDTGTLAAAERHRA